MNEIIEDVIVHSDRLQVAINEAPLLASAFSEVGLGKIGTAALACDRYQY